jgi:hypothetical protein
MAVGGITRRLSMMFTRRKSVAVAPQPMTETDLVKGKKLARELFIPEQHAETVDLSSGQMRQLASKSSKALGGECSLLVTHNATYVGTDMHLLGIVKANVLIAVYELSDYADGLLMKRVCDNVAKELIRNGKLPTKDWPKKYDPVNTFGGSRKLPSGVTTRDLMDAA